MGRFLTTFTAIAALLLGGPLAAAPAQAQDQSFADWTAVVVAGDWHSHDGGETQAFDNARRDVSEALVKAGFAKANVLQFSLRPPKPGDDPKVVADRKAAMFAFETHAKKATGGCLFYVTSHGSPEGAVFGPDFLLRPALLDLFLDEVCGTRPTIAVVSACFSGVFVPALAGPRRMVMTAARPDRSSFGCSDKDKYPYFDACVLESLPQSPDFVTLPRKVKACVNRMETEQNLAPSSEPQTWVGADMQLLLPFMPLKR
jgi:hypothetical protein